MPDPSVTDIVIQFEEERNAGSEPDLAELCGHDPALIRAARERLGALAAVGARVRPPAPGPALPGGYELLGVLGRGGMGVVYKARDRRGAVVAVKTLTHLDPARLTYLKREFQALVGLRHDNLVTIHGQVADGAHWFCVMEYVDGVHLLDHVRGDSPATADTTDARDNPRLRPVFAQLAAGIRALHRANKLHRDIKSTNALVTADGRVKLLDFGLIAEIEPDRERASGPVGTVDYMSPEQFGTQPLTPASDWYSFGTLLYVALCGRLPFSGNVLSIMRAKETAPPLRPSEFASGVPLDLEALCMELLSTSPAARPSGDEVLRRLGGAAPPARPPAAERAALLGRDAHLAALRDAAADVRRNRRPVIVEVHGPSGGGKTALVERFLQGTRDGGDAVILAGRCYEQSSVPYKALDSVIDALLRYLRRLTREQAAAVLPVQLADLARMFPVLGRLDAVAESPPPADSDDPHEARRRGFAALRELCSRIAARKPLFVFADDLQWGDRESAALLEELVRPPDATPLLFVASYRRRDAEGSPFVAALRRLPVERRELAVDPLTEDEAGELAATLLGPATPQAERFAAVIARESGGNPLLVHELVEHQFGQPESTDPPSLDTVIRARVARLADEPRRLLEVVAVAAGPLDVERAFRAAEVPPERQSAALDVLLTGRAVRTVGGEDGSRTAEPFHDRVRETVSRDLPADVRVQHHRWLATVLKDSGGTEPEAVAYHFEHAGDAARAADYYARAGEQSARALAFDQAAEQFRRALDLCAVTDPRRKSLLLARGVSLANAARMVEAAAVFSEAAGLCDGTEAMFCRQRAAEQLIRGGQVDEGMASLKEVMSAVGIAMPATPRALRWSLTWLRLRLSLRGLRFRERPQNEIPPETRLRTEICRWAAGLIRLSDVPLGTWFHSLGLLLSLRAGDAYGVAFALGREAIVPPLLGRQTAERIDRVLQQAQDITAKITNADDRTYAQAVIPLYRVIGCFLLGDVRGSLGHIPAADAKLRGCIGPSVGFQLITLRIFESHSQLLLGEFPRFRDLFTSYQAVTGPRNLHSAVTLPLLARAHQLALADDRPDEARQLIRDAIGLWSPNGAHLQHMWAWWNEAEVMLYERRGADVWAHCLECWSRRVHLEMLDPQTCAFAHWARGRAAVAFAAELGAEKASERRAVLREAARSARALERLRVPYFAPALGRPIRAAVASLNGDRPGALRLLEEAEREFARLGFALHVASVHYCRGQSLGGPVGAELVTAAEKELRVRGVSNPARFIEMYVPGFRSDRPATSEVLPFGGREPEDAT